MISIHIAWLIGLCTAVAILLYIAFIQFRRAEKALDSASILLTNLNTISDYIKGATEQLNNSSLKQAFEADDEIGFFFKEIQDIQQNLNTIIGNEETVTDVQ